MWQTIVYYYLGLGLAKFYSYYKYPKNPWRTFTVLGKAEVNKYFMSTNCKNP